MAAQSLPDDGRFPRSIKFAGTLSPPMSSGCVSRWIRFGTTTVVTRLIRYEVVYPGMHSDVGGGYPPEDQGKARGGTDELVSQIVLHDLYADAFKAGAPLTGAGNSGAGRTAAHTDRLVPCRRQPIKSLRSKIWLSTASTPGATPSRRLAEAPTNTALDNCRPYAWGTTLEDTMAAQLAWLTGWRIGRYAMTRCRTTTLQRQPFLARPINQCLEHRPATRNREEGDKQR